MMRIMSVTWGGGERSWELFIFFHPLTDVSSRTWLFPGRLSQSLTRTEMASSARTILGTCWPPWANWMWRMRSWRPWWRRPAAPSTSPSSWPCSARSWRVCWHLHLDSSSPPLLLDDYLSLLLSPFFFCFLFLTNQLFFLLGADPEDVIVSAFKVLDPEGTGAIKKELWGLLPLPYLLSQKLFGSRSIIWLFHFSPFPPLQPWGAPDHPVRQVHRWGGGLIDPSLTHVVVPSSVAQHCNTVL